MMNSKEACKNNAHNTEALQSKIEQVTASNCHIIHYVCEEYLKTEKGHF
jgi:hypothetical protein